MLKKGESEILCTENLVPRLDLTRVGRSGGGGAS